MNVLGTLQYYMKGIKNKNLIYIQFNLYSIITWGIAIEYLPKLLNND